MANLKPKVEVAFTADPTDPTPTWTDISDYVDFAAGVGIKRGRADEFSTVSAGTANFLIDNSSGAFTPGGSGTYSANVKIGKRCRVSVTDGTTTWTRYVGFVASWGPQEWSETGLYSSLPVTLTDRLANLEGTDLSTPIGNEILYLDPVVYFPLGDPENSTTVADLSGRLVTHPGQVIDGPIVLGTATGPPTDSLTAAQFIGGSSRGAIYVDDQSGLVPASHDWSLFVFANTSVTPPGIQMPFISVFTDDSTYSASAAVGIMGELNLLDVDSNVLVGGATTFADGTTRSVGIVYTAATTTIELFQDGFSLGSVSWTQPGAIVGFRIGSLENGLYQRFTGVEAHAALFDSALSSTDILTIHEAGYTETNTELAQYRMARLARFAGVDPADYFFSADEVVGLQDTTGLTPLAAMRQVEATEDSPLFVGRGGLLTLENRQARYNQTASVTLTAGQYEEDLQRTLDTTNVANIATVSSTVNSDLTARYVDTASVAVLGRRTTDAQIVSTDPKVLQERAQHMATVNSDPEPRWPRVTVDVLTQPALRASLFAMDVNDLLALSGLPSSAGSTTANLIVEGTDETYSVTEQVVSFNCSPAPNNVLQVGHSTLGRIGTTNYLAP